MPMVVGRGRRWSDLIIWWVGVVLQLLFLLSNAQNLQGREGLSEDKIQADLPSAGVQLLEQDKQIVMCNGIVSITLTVPGGAVTNITYKDSGNLLETKDTKEYNRGHWNVVWSKLPEGGNMVDNLEGTSYKIIVQNENQTEISFTRTWKVGSSDAPLNVDKRFVMLRNSPGFYSYAVLERLKGWPAFNIEEGRIVFKLQENKFHYMAMSDDRQRFMPMPKDRLTGETLDYKEAVLLTNPTNPEFKGEVDDKYLYSCDNKDNQVHGWVSSDPPVGFWIITPSNEFRTGGPIKQDLTSHVGPYVLAMFISRHYAGDDIDLKFQTEEYWKKVFGPVFIYLNFDATAKSHPSVLWNDAKQRKEVASWPYRFPFSKDYVKSNQRGAVSGQLLVDDWFINKQPVPGASAFVGLAPLGVAGSWQLESKGYQFWTKTDQNGKFLIQDVIPGTYSLFAWIPGTLGDYKYAYDITISQGTVVEARNMIFKAPREGETLWEIGIPDRSAAEFFIPNPSPKFKIHKYRVEVEKFRQYGLWTRYEDLYPQEDLIFKVGISNYKKDWFFAHVTRKATNDEYVPTTWKILFDLKNINKGANYTLQLALASANRAELQVRFNDPKTLPHFTTGPIGKDNTLARHGIHGVYHFYSIGIAGSWLATGMNTIFLTQASSRGLFREVMYDYIRFEGPI